MGSLVRGEIREPNSAALHLQFSPSLNIAVPTYMSLRVPSKLYTTRVRDVLLIRSSARPRPRPLLPRPPHRIYAPSSPTLSPTYAPEMGASDNRLTQIDMLALARARSPTKVTKRDALYESLGSTPKTNALSKKRASSREDALDALTKTKKAPSRAAIFAISGPL